jgi:hypothetical protein
VCSFGAAEASAVPEVRGPGVSRLLLYALWMVACAAVPLIGLDGLSFAAGGLFAGLIVVYMHRALAQDEDRP